MKTGPELGLAIRQAIQSLNWKSADAAHRWGIKPPSVSEWYTTGRIQTDRLLELMDLCADHLGPEHWGLKRWPGEGLATYKPRECGITLSAPGVRDIGAKDPTMVQIMDLLEAATPEDKLRALGALQMVLATTAQRDRPKKAAA